MYIYINKENKPAYLSDKTGSNVANTRLVQWLHFLKSGSYLHFSNTSASFYPTADVIAWQRANGLTADGLFGQKSYAKMRAAVIAKATVLFLEKYPDMAVYKTTAQNKLYRCSADIHLGEDGYDFFAFMPHYALFYMWWREDAQKQGIKQTSAGSFRPLGSPLTKGRILASRHSFAGAGDLSTVTGMDDVKEDLYIVESAGNRYWTVWQKVDAPFGEEETLSPCTYGNRTGTGEYIKGRFVNFTEVANRNGWWNIPAHKGFYTKGSSYMSAEWWHFQLDFFLMPYFTTYTECLLELYSEAELLAADKIAKSKGMAQIYADNKNKTFLIDF